MEGGKRVSFRQQKGIVSVNLTQGRFPGTNSMFFVTALICSSFLPSLVSRVPFIFAQAPVLSFSLPDSHQTACTHSGQVPKTLIHSHTDLHSSMCRFFHPSFLPYRQMLSLHFMASYFIHISATLPLVPQHPLFWLLGVTKLLN